MASRENRQERVRKTAVREKLWARFKLIGMDRGATITRYSHILIATSYGNQTVQLQRFHQLLILTNGKR